MNQYEVETPKKTMELYGYTWNIVKKYDDGSIVLERELERTSQAVMSRRITVPHEYFEWQTKQCKCGDCKCQNQD